MKPQWHEVPISSVVEPAWAWREVDNAAFEYKLRVSLTRYGQLRPVVVRQVGPDQYEALNGRLILRTLQNLGATTVLVVSLGNIDQKEATAAALALELRQTTDYASLARQVTASVREGGPEWAALVSSMTVVSGDDIDYFRILSSGFDWSPFERALNAGQDMLFEEHDEADEYQAQDDGEGLGPEVVAPPRLEAPQTRQAPPQRAFVPARPAIPLAPGPPPLAPLSLAAEVAPSEPLPAGEVIPPDLSWVLPSSPSGPMSSLAEALAPQGGVQFFGVDRPVSTWKPETPIPLDGRVTSIELDCETDGLEWYDGKRPVGLAVRFPDGRKQYLPFAHRRGNNLDEAQVKVWAQDIRQVHVTNLNTKFDIHMLREWGVDLEAQGYTVSDVAHYAALLDDNRRQFNLEILGQDYLGVGKGDILNKARIADMDPADVADYAMQDVQLVADLKAKLWPLMDAEDLHRVRALEDDLIFPVCEMEKNAAPLNVPLLEEWCTRTERELEQLLWRISKEAGFQVNPDSGADWTRLFGVLGIPITNFTEGANPQPSFTDKVLSEVDHELVQACRRAGKITSLRSKYLTNYLGLAQSTGVLRYNLHQLRSDSYGTVSGRFSASNENIQQVMNTKNQVRSFGSDEYLIRRLFIPRSGLFLSADAEQIEYRLFAHYSAAVSILEAYARNPKTNYHTHVQRMVEPYRPGITYEETKTLNFMKLYGGGKAHTAELLGLLREESDKFVALYDATFPEAKELLQSAGNLAKKRGYVRTYLGRRARFTDSKFAHKALNRVIQGTAADVMKTKIVELHRERKTTGFLMRFTVHDEVDGDIPDVESAQRVEDILNRQSFPFKVPILWKVGTGSTWAEAKA